MIIVRRSITTALALVLASPGASQNVQSASQIQLNECTLAPIQGVSDLTPCSLKFNALGEITFSIQNRGTIGINTVSVTSAVSGGGARAKTNEPSAKIRIDIYLQDKLIQSIYHAALAGAQTKEFTTKIPSNYASYTPKCGETRQLKLVIDPAKQIPESNEANNARARDADRPCPDMAVESIRANYNDLRTEFVAQIKIMNKGNAPARFRYLALTANSSSFGPLPSADFDKLMEIDAGHSKTFTIGNTFATSTMYVRVFLDRFNEVAELDKSNNFREKTLPD